MGKFLFFLLLFLPSCSLFREEVRHETRAGNNSTILAFGGLGTSNLLTLVAGWVFFTRLRRTEKAVLHESANGGDLKALAKKILNREV